MPIDTVSLRAMMPADYSAVRELWQSSENIGLNESDEEPAITSFLQRNAGFSPVATTPDGRIVGALLCGHDGRRGYLHHLAVARTHRGQGLGRALVAFAVSQLRRAGIVKCNLFVFHESHEARSFWEHLGWKAPAWLTMQKRIDGCSSGDASSC